MEVKKFLKDKAKWIFGLVLGLVLIWFVFFFGKGRERLKKMLKKEKEE